MTETTLPQRQCIKCLKMLPSTAEYFSTNKRQPSGFRNECRRCFNKYQRDRWTRLRERTRKTGPRHGYAKRSAVLPEYYSWAGAIQRCNNPNGRSYHRYGGRGIKTCEGIRFFADFITVMGRKPSDEYSIDRKDNEGHYSCGKCAECIANGWTANMQWSTTGDQMRNTSYTRVIEHNGESLCLRDWATRAGVHAATIGTRLRKGMPFAEAIKPVVRTGRTPRIRPKTVTWEGATMTPEALAKRLGMKTSKDIMRFVSRISAGWEIMRAATEPPMWKP